MKKLLTALSVLALGTTTINLNNFLNTNIQKNYLNNLAISQIKGPIWSMTTDKDGNVYAGTGIGINQDNQIMTTGKVFKFLNGQNNFIEMTGINDETITSLGTDKSGNIYALGNKHSIVYKCLVGETNFVKFAQINISMFNYESATRLIITNDGDIYVGTMVQDKISGRDGIGGRLFKINSIGNITEVNGWNHDSGSVRSLAVTSNGTIYAGTITDINKGNLYKSKNDGSFELVSGWSQTNGEVNGLATDKNGNVYVGTSAINVKGQLYKVDNIGKLEKINNWNENNGKIIAISADLNGNVYIPTISGINKSVIIYKNNDNDFTPVKGMENARWIWSMTTDKNGNVYAGGHEEIYKCLTGQDTFIPIL